MNPNLIALIVLISPLFFMATAVTSWFQPGLRPKLVKRMILASTLITMAIAAAGSIAVMNYGLVESSLLGVENLGLSLRLDALSMLMFSMIAVLGFIVVRFSSNYLDGDARQGTFTGRLAATLASVQLLVLSGNLGLLFVAWALTSISLHRLLVFYRERPGAIIAARKKFIVARLGDACLLIAIYLLYAQFGTGNLEAIFQSIQATLASGQAVPGIEAVAILLAAAAILKSAQFPTHGWLIEVMETPTPVSALLHAGLLNAGPFLIIRMAFVMDASSYAPLVLIVLGGFTAIFASVVFLTQTSVKTALGYSSVGHMGFSLLVCGLGVFPAAMLHLVAHSFYKAHCFLSSGSVIDTIRSSKITPAQRIGSPLRIALGILLGLGVYFGFAILWGIDPKTEFSLIAIGAIIALGLSKLFAEGLDSNGSVKLMLRACLLSLLVVTAFFTLESGSHFLLASQLPEMSMPGRIEIILIGILVILEAAVIFIQILAPVLPATAFSRSIAVHLRNGLYVNTAFDRLVRALYSHGTQSKPEPVSQPHHLQKQKLQELDTIHKQPA